MDNVLEYAKNPRWGTPEKKFILLDVKWSAYADEMLFCAAPYDVDQKGVDIFNKAAAGEFGEVMPPPSPTPEEISEHTLVRGLSALQSVAYLTTPEIERHVSPASKAVLAGYIDAVAEIVRLAQEAIRAGKKFEVEIPPLPNVDPLRLTDSGSGFVEFIKPE